LNPILSLKLYTKIYLVITSLIGTPFVLLPVNTTIMSTYTHAEALQPRATYLYEKSNIINVTGKNRVISATVGGAVFAVGGMIKQPFIKKLFKATGLFLMYRGISGNCPAKALMAKNTEPEKHSPAINIRTSFLVHQSKDIAYFMWKDFENLPVFMKHLKEVKVIDENRSYWVMKTLPGMPIVEWEAELLEDNGDVLSWRSLPGSSIEMAGKITFEEWPGGNTQIDVLISYRPPAGYIGTALGVLLRAPFKNIVTKDVENFKHFVEVVKFPGEIV